jgi:hypothetical protein
MKYARDRGTWFGSKSFEGRGLTRGVATGTEAFDLDQGELSILGGLSVLQSAQMTRDGYMEQSQDARVFVERVSSLGTDASELTRCRPAKRDQVFTDRFSIDVVANRIEVGSVGILSS